MGIVDTKLATLTGDVKEQNLHRGLVRFAEKTSKNIVPADLV